MLFGVRICLGRREARGQIHVLPLPQEAVRDPKRSQARHLGGVHADLFSEFTARQLFGIFDFHLPAALGQLQSALLYGVAKLIDKPDSVTIDGQHDRRIVLLHHAVNALLAVAAQNFVLADAHPVVAVDFAAGKCGDGAAGAGVGIGGMHQVSFAACGTPRDAHRASREEYLSRVKGAQPGAVGRLAVHHHHRAAGARGTPFH